MFAEEQAKQAELRKRAEAEKAKQVAVELVESKKRAEAQKGKQAATEDSHSQRDDFERNKKAAADETRRKKAEADNKRNLGATKKLEIQRRKAGATQAEKAAA
jgi:hypothetical protein